MGSGALALAIAGLAAGMAFVITFSFVASNLPLAITRMVPTVLIPQGAGDSNSGKAFYPQEIRGSSTTIIR